MAYSSYSLGLPRTSFLYVPRSRDRDGEVECTQCLSTLGILSIARLFAEEEQFCAICHFSAAHLQRNYLSILPVCSFAPWYRRAVPTLAVGNCWTFNQKVCLCCKKAHMGEKKKGLISVCYTPESVTSVRRVLRTISSQFSAWETLFRRLG